MISRFDYFKKLLEKERDELEHGLEKIAQRNPENPEDWQPVPPKTGERLSDISEQADVFEEWENRIGVEVQLETRLNAVKNALKRIEQGTYGQCEICREEISEARLKANPAAFTCVKHIK